VTSIPAVEASGLCRRYGRRWALWEVGFTVARGARVMLTGRNGSGKSTLLRVLATALHPDLGAARVLGHDVRAARDDVRRRMALLGHYSYHYEALSARENLEVSARFLGRDGGGPALRTALEQVGLGSRADDAVASFSAGMRKRLSLARVLLQQPEVVLLDEPYGELDPAGFLLVDQLLESLRERGATVLMATHLLDRGRALCEQALALEGGRLTYAGPSAELPAPGEAEA
jgi:heme exporter protein A